MDVVIDIDLENADNADINVDTQYDNLIQIIIESSDVPHVVSHDAEHNVKHVNKKDSWIYTTTDIESIV